MSETTGSTSKRTVMITGGTGLVGAGIKEFVSTDKEVIVREYSACADRLYVLYAFLFRLYTNNVALFVRLEGQLQIGPIGFPQQTQIQRIALETSRPKWTKLHSVFFSSSALCVSLASSIPTNVNVVTLTVP